MICVRFYRTKVFSAARREHMAVIQPDRAGNPKNESGKLGYNNDRNPEK